MGYISALFAEKFVNLATLDAPSQDARRRVLWRTAGVDPDASIEPGRMIRDTVFFRFLEHIAEDFADGRSIAIRVGASMRCDDYGAFGLAFKSAIDLRSSFQRVERYGRIVTSIANYTVEPGTGSAFMAVHQEDETRLGLRMTNELAVAAATAMSREVCTQDFSPVAVFFSHDEPTDVSAFKAHFRCPIHFGADRDGLEISDELLNSRNRLGDARISEFFDTHLDRELTQFVGDTPLDELVRLHITQSLSEGVPRLSDIAAKLGMSRRTLQRRLADQGHQYQSLVDAARRSLAEKLLTQTHFALAEIAFLTGYAEQSTFTRAFRRWHGMTPANFRRTTPKT